MLGEIIEDARRRNPSEAVGILAGEGALTITKCIPLRNISVSRGAFWADPFAQWEAFTNLEAIGLKPIAVYHSHPRGGTTLSEADRTFGASVNLYQIVVAVYDQIARFAAYGVNEAGLFAQVDLVTE